jgi:hypothetical protein
MSLNDPLKRLEIENGNDLNGTNCSLKANKTDLVCRGTFDYCSSVRDELVVNRGYTVPAHYQEIWEWTRGPLWQPSDLDHCRHWFSPEYAHPETSEPTDCVKWEDRMDNNDFDQNTSSSMPTLTEDAAARGLDVLDFDGNNNIMQGDNTTMMNVGTSDWACCVAMIGTDDTSDSAAILKKGNKWNVSADFASGAKDIVFTWNDGSAGSLTLSSASLHDDDHISIISFGRLSGTPFLWGRRNTTETITSHHTTATGSLDATQKPLLGGNGTLSFGGANRMDSRIVELIFIDDSTGTVVDVTGTNIYKIEGYLAWKYKCAADILPSGHRFEVEAPSLGVSRTTI